MKSWLGATISNKGMLETSFELHILLKRISHISNNKPATQSSLLNLNVVVVVAHVKNYVEKPTKFQ